MKMNINDEWLLIDKTLYRLDNIAAIGTEDVINGTRVYLVSGEIKTYHYYNSYLDTILMKFTKMKWIITDQFTFLNPKNILYIEEKNDTHYYHVRGITKIFYAEIHASLEKFMEAFIVNKSEKPSIKPVQNNQVSKPNPIKPSKTKETSEEINEFDFDDLDDIDEKELDRILDEMNIIPKKNKKNSATKNQKTKKGKKNSKK